MLVPCYSILICLVCICVESVFTFKSESYYRVNFDIQQVAILSLPEIVALIQSLDSDSQFTAAQSCRRMLSRERKPPIDSVIQAGVLPRLVEFLSRCDR